MDFANLDNIPLRPLVKIKIEEKISIPGPVWKEKRS